MIKIIGHSWEGVITYMLFSEQESIDSKISGILRGRMVQNFNPISPGGGALSAHSLLISRLLIFFSRKRVFLLFDIYYFGVRQFLVKNKRKKFDPTPS